MGQFQGESGQWAFDEVDGELGRGSFGAVYRGEGPNNEPAAIKVMWDVGDNRLRDRELEILRRTNEANSARLVRMLDVGTFGTSLCVALELADTCVVVPPEGFPWQTAFDLSRDIAAALMDLHAIGILHRDLKPSNVLRIGTRVVIADFGIARDSEVGTQDPTFKGWGTSPYMAPELWEGKSPTVRSDLYALGILIYELLAGHTPFSGYDDLRRAHLERSPPVLPPHVPLPLGLLVDRLLSKNPAERYPDARFVVERLDRLSDRMSVTRTQTAILGVIRSADERDLEIRVAQQARHQTESDLHQQGLRDLAELLADTLERLQDMDDRFIPRGELAVPEASEWVIDHPHGGLRLTLWTGHRRDTFLRTWNDRTRDPAPAFGEVAPTKGDALLPFGNIVYDDSFDDQGVRWRLVEFDQFGRGKGDRHQPLEPVDLAKILLIRPKPQSLPSKVSAQLLNDEVLIGLMLQALRIPKVMSTPSPSRPQSS